MAWRTAGSTAFTSLVVLLFVLVQNVFLKQTQWLQQFSGGCSTSTGTVTSTSSARRDGRAESAVIDDAASRTSFNSQCQYFLAESTIPRSGLGVYTAVDIKRGQFAQPTPDICVYITDAEEGQTEVGTHTWQDHRFMAQWETRSPDTTRAACEGLVTLFNSMPNGRYASVEPVAVRDLIHTHAGLTRGTSPGAGAITHYYGASSGAIRDVPKGTELTLWDETWDENGESDDGGQNVPPVRELDWLWRHGLCIDNLRPGPATDPAMGRGAFATRSLPKGTVVAPAPLQIFRDRSEFAKKAKQPEKLFVNYCLQPRGSKMLLFPYGPNFGLINHSSKHPNVVLRWSTFYMNHERWLDLPVDQFWNMQYPGSLMVEVVALRDIRQDEEIYMDYGKEWEEKWNEHVRTWKPVANAKKYVYPTDMDMTKPFLTVAEQEHKPYPKNLMTVCDTYTHDREDNTIWEWRPNNEGWPNNLVDCKILARMGDGRGSYAYNVSLWEDWDGTYIDYNVPQEAISFVDRPYKSDQHLKNAFRHPIGFPDEMTPPQWRDS